jgi:hypothetical protein
MSEFFPTYTWVSPASMQTVDRERQARGAILYRG